MSQAQMYKDFIISEVIKGGCVYVSWRNLDDDLGVAVISNRGMLDNEEIDFVVSCWMEIGEEFDIEEVEFFN